MRLANRYADPHCEQMMKTWSPSTLQVAVTQDGRHWKYSLPTGGSLLTEKLSDCLLVELMPASAWESLYVEWANPLYSSDGLLVADVSKKERNFVGLHTVPAVEATPIGMCFIGLDEWPILQEAGARIFAADTAPY